MILALSLAFSFGIHGCDDEASKSTADESEPETKKEEEEKKEIDEDEVAGLLRDLDDRKKEKAAVAELEKLGPAAIPLMKDELRSRCGKIAAAKKPRERRRHAMKAGILAEIMKKHGEPGESAIKDVIGVVTDSHGKIGQVCEKRGG
jgi:hypothetical protein